MSNLWGTLLPLLLAILAAGPIREADAQCDAATEFTCSNGNCILKEYVNDTINDCGDNSEEGFPFVCEREGDFKCTIGPGYCPGPTSYFNDGKYKDCPDSSDEWKTIGLKCISSSGTLHTVTTCDAANPEGIGDGAYCNTVLGVCECLSGYMVLNRGKKCQQRVLYDPCITAGQDTDCYDAVPNTVCLDHASSPDAPICLCKTGWYAELPLNTTCVKRKIHDDCDVNVDCSAAVTNSNCTDNEGRKECLCNTGYLKSADLTECNKRRITSECELDTDCSDAVPFSECDDATKKCVCLYNYTATADLRSCLARKVDDACVATDHCQFAITGLVECTENTCSCTLGHKADATKTVCTKRKIGDSCPGPVEDCSAAVENSNCTSLLCYCNSGYYKNTAGTTCTLRKLDDPCDLNTDCSFAVIDSYCETDQTSGQKLCKCLTGWMRNAERTNCTRRRIGDECSVDPDCSKAVGSSFCNGEKQCECNVGYLANAAKDRCTKRKIGDQCSVDLDCSAAVTASNCTAKICYCNNGYYASEDKTLCSRRQIGDNCASTGDCAAVIENGDCVDGICVCTEGTRVNTLLTACFIPNDVNVTTSTTPDCTDFLCLYPWLIPVVIIVVLLLIGLAILIWWLCKRKKKKKKAGQRIINPYAAYGTSKPWAFARPKSGVAVMYEDDNMKEPDDMDCMTEITDLDVASYLETVGDPGSLVFRTNSELDRTMTPDTTISDKVNHSNSVSDMMPLDGKHFTPRTKISSKQKKPSAKKIKPEPAKVKVESSKAKSIDKNTKNAKNAKAKASNSNSALPKRPKSILRLEEH